MKTLTTIITALVSQLIISQSAFVNHGAVQLHGEAQIGFHTNLVNEGSYRGASGMSGFYGEELLRVSGSQAPEFYDVELGVEKGLYLSTSIKINNSQMFIAGKIHTPRTNPEVLVSLGDAVHVGESDESFVSGYAAVTNGLGNVIPVGDQDKLSGVTIESGINNTVTAAYFQEDPTFPSTFAKSFTSSSRSSSVESVSRVEYWDVRGEEPVSITLSWDSASRLSGLTGSVKDVTIVGWSKTDREWVNLGSVTREGTLESGKVTSMSFIPNAYEIITIGSVENESEEILIAEHVQVLKTNVFDTAGRLVKVFKGEEAVDFTGMAKGVFITDTYLSNGERFAKKILNR